jgi:hypothetical protein
MLSRERVGVRGVEIATTLIRSAIARRRRASSTPFGATFSRKSGRRELA